jgi:hypothetical protein
MEASLAGMIQRLIELLKLQSTLPALLWLVINYITFGEYLEDHQLLSWWIELQMGELVALLFLMAIFLGYALDSLNFFLLDLSISESFKFAWLPVTPPRYGYPLELGSKMRHGAERILKRYGIHNADLVWPHLSAVLSKNGYVVQIEREKAELDFFLNLSLLSLIFVAECILAHMFGWSGSFIIPWLSLGTTLFFYRLAILSTGKWYDWINAAFDLYRYDLAKQLALRPFKYISDEKKIWANVTRFLQEDKVSEYLKLDYPLPPIKQTKE